MEPARKKELQQKPHEVFDLFNNEGTNAKTAISRTHTQELVIALCGPIGSPLHEVADAIHRTLTDKFDYEDCKRIKLSSFIEKYASSVNESIPSTSEFEKISAQINVGNALRKKYGAAILAELAVHDIRVDREQHKEKINSAAYLPRRVCHIVDSIKNQEELELLRTVYREMLYVVGVFVPLEQREESLKKRGLQPHETYKLIDRDSGEESNEGQTVRETFPQSDFFLRIDSGTDTQLTRRVERFLHLILGTKLITPTANETAMYAAASAAANSACLSRQVGAAVTNSDGAVISIGWNDVPQFAGGLYGSNLDDSQSADHDQRCWNRGGKCYNDEEKDIFAANLVEALSGFIPADRQDEAKKKIVEFPKLRGLIEFSRSIHAEMHAILNAGKFAGGQLAGGKLFVTTYPCHSCARHIIASGIKEVYYIEPYRKSLAVRLHGDAISEREHDVNKVILIPYDGVAPSRYLALFKVPADSRKENGKLVRVALRSATPRQEKSLEAFPTLEALVVKYLGEKQIISNGVPAEDGPTAA